MRCTDRFRQNIIHPKHINLLKVNRLQITSSQHGNFCFLWLCEDSKKMAKLAKNMVKKIKFKSLSHSSAVRSVFYLNKEHDVLM